MMDAITPPLPLRPPVPAPPETDLSFRGFLRAVRTNALTIFPRAAFEQDYVVRSLLGRKNIIISAPDAIHHILVGNPGNFRRSPASIRILRPLTGEGLLLSEGDSWKFQRRVIAPALAPRVMPMLSQHIVASTNRAIDHLAAETKPIDLLTTMQNLALDIASRSMFSLEMDRDGPILRNYMLEFSQRHSHPSLLDMVLPTWIMSPNDFGRHRFRRRWMGFIETILRGRLAQPPPQTPRDLFDLLRAARDPETGAAFTPSQLRDQVATLILAGHQTTAVTLFWAIIMLAQAEDEQAWLAQEVAGVTITPEAVPQLIRTRAVANETLRLFPAAYVIARETIRREHVAGIDLTPGSLALIAPWVLHRHRRLWDDPAAFLPARFMPDQPPPGRFAFMPFGAGPRVCVGAQFALAEAILVLAAIIGRFRVTRVDTTPVLPIGIVTTQPAHRAQVRLTPR